MSSSCFSCLSNIFFSITADAQSQYHLPPVHALNKSPPNSLCDWVPTSYPLVPSDRGTGYPTFMCTGCNSNLLKDWKINRISKACRYFFLFFFSCTVNQISLLLHLHMTSHGASSLWLTARSKSVTSFAWHVCIHCPKANGQTANSEALQKELQEPRTLQTGVSQYLSGHLQVFPPACSTVLSLIKL